MQGDPSGREGDREWPQRHSREGSVSPARGSRKKSGARSGRSQKTQGPNRQLWAWTLFAFVLGLGALWGVLTMDRLGPDIESSSEIGQDSRQALRDILRDAGESE